MEDNTIFDETRVIDAESTASIGTFEGPEKTLEICFKPGIGPPSGLRDLTREQLNNICASARCTIISTVSNDDIDSYVLSESSLFVYKHRFIMKTCGTTTLLACLALLIQYTDDLGLEIYWMSYSRKNLMFPDEQLFPHNSHQQEIDYLRQHPNLQSRLCGAAYLLGPITGDHWFVYVASSPPSSTSILTPMTPSITNQMRDMEGITLNMMMFGMDEQVSKKFYKTEGLTPKMVREDTGISGIVGGCIVDDVLFSPCGYSMNAISYSSYYTIHITPQPSCSYVSFETNILSSDPAPLCRNVLDVFKPERCVVTVFSDQGVNITMGELRGWKREDVSRVEMSELNCMMSIYRRCEGSKRERGNTMA